MLSTVRSQEPAAYAARTVRLPSRDRDLSHLTCFFCSISRDVLWVLFADIRRLNQDIIVRLKWGQTEYKGRLLSVDSYMNLQLSNTEEFIDRKSTGTLARS